MISIETMDDLRNVFHILDEKFCEVHAEVLLANSKTVQMERLTTFNKNMKWSFDQLSACVRKLRNLNQVHAIYVSDLRRQFEKFCKDNSVRVIQLQEPQRNEINLWIANLESIAEEQHKRLSKAIELAIFWQKFYMKNAIL